jgi:hypothetical protein
MFDIQVLALESDMTRVISFKTGRDASSRVYPESGSNRGFHPASHHGGREAAILDFNLINRYHVSMLPYFLDKLKNTPEGAGNVLDNSAILFVPEGGHGTQLNDASSQWQTHSTEDMVILVAGRAGGLQPGQHIATGGAHPAQCLVSGMQAAGYTGDTLGEVSGNVSALFG